MKISVFASSSSKIDKVYFKAASKLGSLLAEQGHEIIFGGGSIGLMGALADAALEKKGSLIGVIPQFMKDRGWGHPEVKNMIITEDMSTRKQAIFNIAEAVIALPGGIGTVEELTESITLKQLGIYKGPLVIMNINNFYVPLLSFLDQLIESKFMRDSHKGIWNVVDSPESAVSAINNYKEWMHDPIKIARI
jgi:uncharacterized protein (TIGR00730 family)